MSDAVSTIDALSAAMDIHQFRANIAAQNIAKTNVNGALVSSFDYNTFLTLLSGKEGVELKQAVQTVQTADLNQYVHHDVATKKPSLDELIMEVSSASGRYQQLADGVSRQFGLMQLAIKGGR